MSRHSPGRNLPISAVDLPQNGSEALVSYCDSMWIYHAQNSDLEYMYMLILYGFCMDSRA